MLMRHLAMLALLACVMPFTLFGDAPVAAGPGEWIEPSSPAEQAALATAPQYQRFLQSAPGDWRASFDPVLTTPRAIYGSGLALVSIDADERRVESAAAE
jgi:hypothetical protein